CRAAGIIAKRSVSGEKMGEKIGPRPWRTVRGNSCSPAAAHRYAACLGAIRNRPKAEYAGMAATPMVTGLSRDRESAERAYRALAERGYGEQDINLVMSDETRQRHFGDGRETGDGETGLETKAAEGAGIGGALGGTLGAIA